MNIKLYSPNIKGLKRTGSHSIFQDSRHNNYDNSNKNNHSNFDNFDVALMDNLQRIKNKDKCKNKLS